MLLGVGITLYLKMSGLYLRLTMNICGLMKRILQGGS